MMQCAALKNLLPNLAYANDFAPNPQPSAYFKLVPGCLTAKDEYARCFYCLTCGLFCCACILLRKFWICKTLWVVVMWSSPPPLYIYIYILLILPVPTTTTVMWWQLPAPIWQQWAGQQVAPPAAATCCCLPASIRCQTTKTDTTTADNTPATDQYHIIVNIIVKLFCIL
jgi:hypothetical protein